MQTKVNEHFFKRTVSELKNLPDQYLEEAYDFVKYLRMKSIREKNWKKAFYEALDEMHRISKKRGITKKDVEREIALHRKGKS
jgi:hypothetical protein